MIECHHQTAIFHADGDGAVPRVLVDTGIFLERQRRLGVGGAGGFGLLHSLGRVLFLRIFAGLEGGYPVCRRQLKVVIEHMEEDGIEGAVLFSVREHDDAEILFWYQHDARDESANASRVPYQLAAVIIAQSPA